MLLPLHVNCVRSVEVNIQISDIECTECVNVHLFIWVLTLYQLDCV